MSTIHAFILINMNYFVLLLASFARIGGQPGWLEMRADGLRWLGGWFCPGFLHTTDSGRLPYRG